MSTSLLLVASQIRDKRGVCRYGIARSVENMCEEMTPEGEVGVSICLVPCYRPCCFRAATMVDLFSSNEVHGSTFSS